MGTFGLVTMIPHYADTDATGTRWRMFALDLDSASTVVPSSNPPISDLASAKLLVVAPNGVGILDSANIEDVLLLRDEAADMAWGVERSALGPSGQLVDRKLAWKTGLPHIAPPSGNNLPNYRLGSTVPDYWIPFLPVPAGATGATVELRRGKLPTATTGPIGQILAAPGLSIFLEELPREGVHLARCYRYARGIDGSTYLWIGRDISAGTGEGRSGLRFDFLEF